MIRELKLAVLRAICKLTEARCRLQGMKTGRGCFIDGRPRLRLQKGSRVILGDSVTLMSRPRHNPLCHEPVHIQTLTPEAVVEFKAHSGITGSRIVCCNRVTIGEYTIIGADTLVYDSEGHDYTPETGWNSPRSRRGRPITIGEKCFIGTRCMILSGVTIGDHCVVAAGSVVTTDVPPGHIASGNPAQCKPLPRILGGCEPDGTETPDSSRDASEGGKKLEPASFLEEVKAALELEREIGLDDAFRDYEEWDSLAFLSLVAMLRDEYGLGIEASDFNGIDTWADLLRYMERQRNHMSETEN